MLDTSNMKRIFLLLCSHKEHSSAYVQVCDDAELSQVGGYNFFPHLGTVNGSVDRHRTDRTSK